MLHPAMFYTAAGTQKAAVPTLRQERRLITFVSENDW